jgi:hypothetical protein
MISYFVASYTRFSDLAKFFSLGGWFAKRFSTDRKLTSPTKPSENKPTVIADGNGGVVAWES